MLEPIALLLLAAALGLPGALRWLAFGLLGPVVLVLVVAWLLRADLSNWYWWVLGCLAAVAALGVEGAWIEHRDSRANESGTGANAGASVALLRALRRPRN